MACVVSVGTFGAAALVVHLRLPMDVGSRIKLVDLKLRFAIGAKTTNCTVHDITGNTLLAVDEVVVFLSVERAVVHLAISNVRVIKTLFDEGEIIRVVNKDAVNELKWVWRLAALWH